jgi:hypothetical protein
MEYRYVVLPLFDILTDQLQDAALCSALLAVPGVHDARLQRDRAELDLEYDPIRCGARQLLEAIDAFGAGRACSTRVSGRDERAPAAMTAPAR